MSGFFVSCSFGHDGIFVFCSDSLFAARYDNDPPYGAPGARHKQIVFTALVNTTTYNCPHSITETCSRYYELDCARYKFLYEVNVVEVLFTQNCKSPVDNLCFLIISDPQHFLRRSPSLRILCYGQSVSTSLEATGPWCNHVRRSALLEPCPTFQIVICPSPDSNFIPHGAIVKHRPRNDSLVSRSRGSLCDYCPLNTAQTFLNGSIPSRAGSLARGGELVILGPVPGFPPYLRPSFLILSRK